MIQRRARHHSSCQGENGLFQRVAGTISHHWAARKLYAGWCDWGTALYSRLLVRLPQAPLPWRNAVASVRVVGVAEPLYVRLGTSDWFVVEELFLHGEYAPLLERQPAGVRTVVDLGANVGYSLRLWEEVFPDCALIAVEPDVHNLEMCRRNAARSLARKRLCLVQACVAGRPREVYLDRSAGAWAFKMRERPAGSSDPPNVTQAVPAMTFLDVLGMAGLDPAAPIDLLKCDIEGAEREVFADCASWIGRVRNLVVEVHGSYTKDLFMDDLRRAGGRFELYRAIMGSSHSVLFLAAE